MKFTRYLSRLFLSLVVLVALRAVSFGYEIKVHPEKAGLRIFRVKLINNNVMQEVPENDTVRTSSLTIEDVFKSSDEVREHSVGVKESLSSFQKSGSVATPTSSGWPLYYQMWPFPTTALDPRYQYYWYYRSDDTIYLVVADVALVFPDGYIPPSDIPNHQGQQGHLGNMTIYPNETLRHRIVTTDEPRYTPVGLTPYTFYANVRLGTGLDAPVRTVYMNMANSSGHVGYVHFFPLWKLSSLTAYPDTYFSATSTQGASAGKATSMPISFDPEVGIRLIEWRYIP